MRALTMAAVLGIALSLLPPSGRSAEACSFERDYRGWEAVDLAIERADLVIAGKVASVQPVEFAYPADIPETVTVAVSSVLRGRIDGSEMTFPNVRQWCHYGGAVVEPGEQVLFFLYWQEIRFGSEDYQWFVDYWAPKLVVHGDEVYVESFTNMPQFTMLGFKDRVFQRIGTDLGADQPAIDAAIAGGRAETGWGLVGVFGAAATMLLAGSLLVRRHIAQATEAKHDSAS